jgi:trehalose/maltose hydrolase-like predicted phosphorylase
MTWHPISPPPVTIYKPDYLPAYLSNGLIGMRVGAIPLVEGVCIVNGLVELDPVEQGEGFARGPYPIAGDIELDGRRLSQHPGQGVFVEQAYDFSCGELRSRFQFRPADVTATVNLLIFCSRSLPTLVLKEMQVEVDRECQLLISSGLDPAGLSGRWLGRRTTTPGATVPIVDGLMQWETHGGLSSCGAAYTTTFEGGDGVERHVEDIDRLAPLTTSYTVKARPGRRYVLRQIASLIPSQLHSEPDRQAARMTFLGQTKGFDQIRKENRAIWKDLWKARITLVGSDRRWQQISDASFFYLHTSAHPSSLFSTSMFGLAYWPNYHYYRGHVMWDIEGFAVPVFTLTQPNIARALLGYRLRHMVAARRNAAMNGYAGIQFPWAGSPVHGEEVIRLSAPRIIFEQHVSLSVAIAFARFAHVTGDTDFLRQQAWPVLSGVADWIANRGQKTDRGFEIHECLGIAEQDRPHNNNAYVNMAAAVVAREAAAAARRLGHDGAELWEEIAASMFVPIDPQANVVLNHEGYRCRPGNVADATPEALAGFFPVGYATSPEVEHATLRFYLDHVDPYVGYPMLSAPLGAWAARLGDRELSAKMFEAGYAEFIEEPFWVTNEFSSRFPDRARAGPLVANVGGFLTSLLYGLPGIEADVNEPQSWSRRSVVMPELWEGIEVERVWVRGRPASLRARHGDHRAQIEF